MIRCDDKQRHELVVMVAVFSGLTAFLPDKSFDAVSGATMMSLIALVLHGIHWDGTYCRFLQRFFR